MSAIDTAVFLWLNATSDSPHWLVPLARFVTRELPEWMIVGSIAAFIVGDSRVQRCVIKVVLALGTAWLFARLGQGLFPTERPFALGLGHMWMTHSFTAGFPSTHATVAFAFAFVVLGSTRRWLPATAAFGVAIVVGWSRVTLGLHFPSDVLGGVIIGGLSAWLSGQVPVDRLSARLFGSAALKTSTSPP
jgi:undecaprenyl-diphosphatase